MVGLALGLMTGAGGNDVLDAWDQFTRALTNYKVVGLTGLIALGIAVLISVTKRWRAGDAAPNWWMRLPAFGRTLVVAGLGVIGGVVAAIQGGADPGQAVVIGLSGLLSILGHEFAQKVGLAGQFASDPQRMRDAMHVVE